ncbi:MAG: hypothetical protein RJA07_775 [Bacteroidota bacterium]|jgi:hypothetical protein
MDKIFISSFSVSKRLELLLKIISSILFLIISFALFYFHEPWRDELQAFSLVRNSHSIVELYQMVRYEGHPLGWYILQKGVFFLNPNFIVVRFVHWLLATIGVIILIWKAPFPIVYRILISLGYFFTYEYTAIARNYGIALPFYMLLCILFSKKKYLLFGVIAAIAMQFSLYSFIISFSVSVFYFFHYKQKKNIAWYVGILFTVIGVLLFKLSVNPPDDIGTSPGWNLSPDSYTAAFSVIANAFFTVFKFDIHFWNTSFFQTFLNYDFTQAVQFVLSIFIFGWIIKTLYKNKTALYIFIFGTAIMMFFMASKYHGSVRHHGHIYVLFLISLWIGNTTPSNILQSFSFSQKTKTKLLFFPDKYVSKFFVFVLILQIVGSLQSIYFETKYPFSDSKEVAQFLQKNYPNSLVISCSDGPGTAVSIIMAKQFYYPNSFSWRENLCFNNKRGDIGYSTLIAQCDRFFLDHTNGVLLISKSTSTLDFIDKIPYKKIKDFQPAIREDESYILFKK